LAIPTAAGGATVRADGVEAHRAEVSLLTAGGVPVAGQEVVLKWSYNGRNGPAAGTATATSAANGVASWDFTAVEDSLWTVEAQVEGAVVPGSPALAEFQGGAPAWRPLQPPQVGPSNGSRAVGTVQVGDVEEAEAGSLQAVALDASGVELGRAQVAGGGGFDVALAPVLADGARFSVRLEGAAGAVSPATQVVVDAVAPWPGTVSPSGGAALSGTGEAAGVAVVVRGSGGVELCRAQVAADLSWTCDLVPDALVGDVVSVEHSDAAGNAASVSWRIGLPGASVVVPQVRVGEQQTATGTNFQPGELVEAVLQPGSVPVGSGNANAAGGAQFQWVIPAGTVLGSHTVELSGALSGTESAQFDVLPALVPPDAAASQLTVPTAVGGLTVLADAVAKHRAVVAVVDAAGAPMPGAVVDFAWSYVDGAGVPRSGTGQATAGSGGVAVWEFSSADEAVWTVSASVGGVAVGGSPKTAEFKGRPPVSGPGLSRLESPAGSAPADGSSQLAVTAWALDAQGRALPGADVVFSIPSGVKAGLVVGPAVVSVAADAAGRAVLSLTAAAAGTYQVTAVVTTVYGSVAVTEGSPASVVFTQPGPGAPLLAPSADPSNGARVSGRAQSGDLPEAAAGRLVAVVADASTGAELARGPVAADGSFEVALSPPAGHGARLSVRLEGVGRSASPAVLVEVDAVPPSPGAMVPSDGTAASGAGEAPGHVVSVLGPGGAELCSAVVGADLSWECDLVPDAAEGDLVAVEHRDAAGNVTRVEWRIGLPRVEVAASSLRPGESQTATGVNFQPGEQVTAVMRSAPVTVGTSSADADGRVEFTWTVPADTEAGVHTVELTGPLSGIQTVEFQVEPAGEPTQPPTEPPPTEPPATEPPPTEPPATEPPPTSGPAQTASTPGPAPTGGQSGSPLPTTGAGAIPGLVGTAVVSVLAGAVLLMAAWRRRRI
jgi:translation initiation factor IF-1